MVKCTPEVLEAGFILKPLASELRLEQAQSVPVLASSQVLNISVVNQGNVKDCG